MPSPDSEVTPEMTGKHLGAISCAIPNVRQDEAALRDVESLVRSLVSGELALVRREEIAGWYHRVDAMDAMHRGEIKALGELATDLHRWLSATPKGDRE
jgi:hypothetical protein